MKPNWERRLIPKWRSSNITSTLPESLPVFKDIESDFCILTQDDRNYILSILKEWKDNKSIGGAANILNFGHDVNIHPLIEEPATYIIDHSESVPSHLLDFANKILNIKQEITNYNPVNENQLHSDAILLKRKISNNPKDAIALVDLARIYTSLGQNKKAERAILTAVSLYPNHRFILRSASRFFIHNNDAEHSLYLLNRSSRTKFDPWLMASHISISAILEKPQKLIKQVKELIKSESFHPIHMSELCCSLATVQIIDGNNKEARRNFNKALNSPNDNTIAQAIWTVQNHKIPITMKPEWFIDPFRAEAKYYNFDLLGNFEDALEAAQEWQHDEPFSINPAIAVVYSASLLEKYQFAENIAKQALILHHDDFNLQNNLVFTLAAQNKIEEASNLLINILHQEQRLEKISPQSIANLGMIYYRSGDIENGEKMYRSAIDRYEKENDSLRKAIAISFLAKEATIAKAPNAENLLVEAISFVSQVDAKPAEKVLSSINGVVINSNTPSLIKPLKWKWDKERNLLIIQNNKPFKDS